MRIHCLQHVPFEGPASIADWAVAKGYRVRTTPLFEGADLPSRPEFDLLLVMGGPMGIYDEAEYPWLAGEKVFLRETIAAEKTVVGICLGAQLLADVLGAPVYRNAHKEIGWFPMELTAAGRSSDLFGFLPQRLDVFHWHGDTFGMPAGAVHLARSEGCENQAFLYEGRVLGLQFHLESTPRSVQEILSNCADEIVPSAYVQNAERMLAATTDDYRRINQAMHGILDHLPG